MSEENQQGGAPSNQPSGNGNDERDFQERIAALEKKNEELLSEKKKVQGQLGKFEAERQKAEEERLKAEGKTKELLELSEKKNLELAKKFKTRLLDTQVREAARIAGVTDENAFMRLAGDYESKVQIDDDFNINQESLNGFINGFKEEFKSINLFKSDVKPPQDGGTGEAKPTPPKAPAQMNRVELGANLKENLSKVLGN